MVYRIAIINRVSFYLYFKNIWYSCNSSNVRDHYIDITDVIPVIFSRGLILLFPLIKLVDTLVALG